MTLTVYSIPSSWYTPCITDNQWVTLKKKKKSWPCYTSLHWLSPAECINFSKPLSFWYCDGSLPPHLLDCLSSYSPFQISSFFFSKTSLHPMCLSEKCWCLILTISGSTCLEFTAFEDLPLPFFVVFHVSAGNTSLPRCLSLKLNLKKKI